jgi:thiol-disulfide isomerase/thioredoxin
MKLLFLLAASFCSVGLAHAQDSLWITPTNPQPGAQVTVHVVTDKKGPLEGGFYSIAPKSNIQAHELVLQKDGKAWAATVSIPDTATSIVASVRDASGQALAATAVGLYGTDGQPLPDGYNGLALAYTSTGEYLFGMKSDDDKAKTYRDLHWAAMTGHLRTFSEKIAYALDYKKDTAKAFKEMAALPLDSNATEQDYAQASSLASRMKNKPLGELLTNLRNQKYPHGAWRKSAYYAKMNAASDGPAKEKVLKDFETEFPDDAGSMSAGPMSWTSALQQQLAEYYAQQGDLAKAMAFIPAGADGSTKATLYNDIAWYSALADKSIPEATTLSKASLDTLTALQAGGQGKPGYLTRAQYIRNLQSSYGMFADTYGFLLYKNGDYKNAYKYETIAFKSSPNPQKDIVERYFMTMEKNEKPSKVVASLSTYIQQGKSDSVMDAQFKRLYRGKGSADDALAALSAKADADKKAEMIKTILNDTASNFVLRDLKGNRVSLDTLKGKTVVLDFWATWCGPCKASFPAMQQLVDNHKGSNDVVLLFIDTWENADDKNKNAQDFITASPYTFHVLMDNDNEVVGKYKVTGIPTKFVIGPDGMLKFKAVGFSGDTKGTVTEMENMIQLASKP